MFESHIGFELFSANCGPYSDSPVDDLVDAIGYKIISFDRIERECIECLARNQRDGLLGWIGRHWFHNLGAQNQNLAHVALYQWVKWCVLS